MIDDAGGRGEDLIVLFLLRNPPLPATGRLVRSMSLSFSDSVRAYAMEKGCEVQGTKGVMAGM